MTEQENRILFALIEPKACWHMWKPREKAVGNQYEKKYACVICGTRANSKSECVQPDFTLPEWRIRLQEWIVENDNIAFYLSFVKWQWSNYDIIEGSRDKLWVMHIILNLSQEILDYLHTDEAKKMFGWVECSTSFDGCKCEEFTCDGMKKIKAPWLVELDWK